MASSASKLYKESAKTDSKGRIVLGERFKEKQFSVYIRTDGVIQLIPTVTIPEKELWLFKNKKAMNMLKNGLEDAKNGDLVELGSFAKYSDFETDD